MAKQTTKRPVTSPRSTDGKKEPEASRLSPTPDHDEIARRAHELYLTRGAVPGRDLEDWLEAERQLQNR